MKPAHEWLEVRCCCDASQVVGYVEVPAATARYEGSVRLELDDGTTRVFPIEEVRLRQQRAFRPTYERRWRAINSDGCLEEARRIRGLRPARDGSTGNGA